MPDDARSGATPERLVDAAVRILAAGGPSALKVRSVAGEAGLSTMVVYSHFGGVPELVRAVVERGFQRLDAAIAGAPRTTDPVADLFGVALATRAVAHDNPHLYDLMFGLSTRATYRPVAERDQRLSAQSPGFRVAHAELTAACARLLDSGRLRTGDLPALAAATWTFAHGFISLELGGHFAEFDDPVAQVMLPMGVALCVGLGDDPDRARASHLVALRGR